MANFHSCQIAWGCLPPGTQITLPNGRQVPVERLKAGDQVLADHDGGVLTVVEVMNGEESEPLVEIEDSLGHRLTMTSAHAVPTAKQGVVEARELAVGTVIEDGRGPG